MPRLPVLSVPSQGVLSAQAHTRQAGMTASPPAPSPLLLPRARAPLGLPRPIAAPLQVLPPLVLRRRVQPPHASTLPRRRAPASRPPPSVRNAEWRDRGGRARRQLRGARRNDNDSTERRAVAPRAGGALRQVRPCESALWTVASTVAGSLRSCHTLARPWVVLSCGSLASLNTCLATSAFGRDPSWRPRRRRRSRRARHPQPRPPSSARSWA